MCQVLGVSRSGYYAWVKRVTSPPKGRAAADAVLLEQIRAIHAEFAFYGAPGCTASCGPSTAGSGGTGSPG
jgi:hypothetical protein